MEKIMEKLIIIENPVEILTELFEDKIIDLNEIISSIFHQIVNIQNETKINFFAQFIARICFKTKSFNSINDYFKSYDMTQSMLPKGILLKKILIEISKRSLSHCLYYKNIH